MEKLDVVHESRNTVSLTTMTSKLAEATAAKAKTAAVEKNFMVIDG